MDAESLKKLGGAFEFQLIFEFPNGFRFTEIILRSKSSNGFL